MTRKITTFAIFTALMVIGGYILYFITKLLPIPGSKFIVMGPYLTFILMLILIRYPRFGTMTLINVVFGGVMFIISPWMTLSIVVSGLVADCAMLLPIWLKAKQLLSMGIYNGMSLLTYVYVTNYITGNMLYKVLNFEILIFTLAFAFITGILGAYVGIKVDKKYLKFQKRDESKATY
jgi:energy-coupling factor transport system substrate-specific component